MFVCVGEYGGQARSKVFSLLISVIGTVLAASIFLATIPSAHAASKFAAITIDAKSGRIIFARNADSLRYPASLTKIMTLYLLFQDLEAGRLTIDSRLRVSRHAASMQPSKLGLKPGSSIKVRHAIKALVTKSANDVAATVAENLAGSEPAFARRMTRTARALGMTRTTFANASGLPNRRQRTTARDMATLGLRIQKDFPQYYTYFRTRSFTYKGRKYGNHNRLLGRFKGIDGIKTGYTRASGFNLTSSVRRKGKHVIGVVMGAKSGRSRNRYMAGILKTALKKVPYRKKRYLASTAGKPPGRKTHVVAALKPRKPKVRPNIITPNGQSDSRVRILNANGTAATHVRARMQSLIIAKTREPKPEPVLAPTIVAEPKSNKSDRADMVRLTDDVPARALPAKKVKVAKHAKKARAGMARGKTWQIQIGAYKSAGDALSGLTKAKNTGLKSLRGKKAMTMVVDAKGNRLYRARFAGFSRNQAKRACKSLSRRSFGCLTIAPRS
ncbi:MAG: D-alanyl-D-alanine carboxypeptidase [Alphaproteobacteria bacterium]|nr:D-alanyl-D-alanine carboxypeptidase [Alphaproteobacteria bacterium]